MKTKQKTVIMGLGAMGGALVRGWIEQKMIPAPSITAVDIDPQKLKQAAVKLKIQTQKDPTQILPQAGIILLATKPQQMRELLFKTGPFFPQKALVISIAAGISTQTIEKFLPQGCPVVRVMPNTPALLGAGMAAVAGGKRAKKADLQKVLKLFSAVGKAIQVREDQMDLVTAISGSGPAYFFHLVELMTEAAIKGGLTPKEAHLLVSQTAFGSSRMILETGKSPSELRVQVTSPGGTTQAALEIMAKRGLRETVKSAINAAVTRGAELRRLNNL
jgi:pyrroline-5-carboxylate reductase